MVSIEVMELKSLKIFAEVVQSRSFSQAAERLCMTQPSMSKAIAHLEQELGVDLFKKGRAGRKRENQLTQTGELIYSHAQVMLAEQQKIYNTLQQLLQLKKGRLTLGLPPLGSVLLSPLIAIFHHHYPEIELQFLEVGASQIEQALEAKNIDVGIVLGGLKSGLAAIPIIDSPLCMVATKKSGWAGRQHVDLIELKEQHFLLYADSFSLNNVILNAARSVGFEPQVVCKSGQWDFITKMVEFNMGLALLPKIYCDQLDHALFDVVPLKAPQLNWTLSMAWNTSVDMTPATRAWLKIVDENRDKIPEHI